MGTYTFSILGGANATLFSIVSGTQLIMVPAGVRGNNLTVVIGVTNSIGLKANSTFFISETDVAPTDITLSNSFYSPIGVANGS